MWLVTVPNNKESPKTTYSAIRNLIETNSICETNRFEIPGLVVGTLDSLMALSDDLSKIGLQVEVRFHFFLFKTKTFFFNLFLFVFFFRMLFVKLKDNMLIFLLLNQLHYVLMKHLLILFSRSFNGTSLNFNFKANN